MATHTARPRGGRRAAAALTAAALAAAGTVTACGSATAHPSAATPPAVSSTPASRSAQLSGLVQQLVDAGAPGVIVRVDDGNGPVIAIARQASWTTANHTLSAGDQFRMGSNTKTMVATLVLQLVAAKKLSLDDSVEKWLPGLVPNGSAITIRMLLNHTSGLFNDVNDPAVLKAFTGQDPRTWTPQQLLAAAVAHPPLFAPGSQYSYSNTNYVALGLILEKASGQGLAALIQDRIAKPLGLSETYLADYTPDPANTKLAHGYEPNAATLASLLPPGTPTGSAFAGPASGTFVDTTWINDSSQWAAGAIVSTASDWSHFQAALLSGKLLPPAQLKEMETTVSEGSSTPNRYGLGLERVQTPCGAVWGHDGQVPGYSSENYTDDTGHRTVAIFATTIFGLAEPKTAAANQNLINAAVCAMLDKPIPR